MLSFKRGESRANKAYRRWVNLTSAVTEVGRSRESGVPETQEAGTLYWELCIYDFCRLGKFRAIVIAMLLF